MDRRTLLRKLKSEGTTFKDLLEDTRKKLAHDYLVEAFSITQISFMLGFSATSSFQVAFKRWYNQSPGDYRRDHLAESSPKLQLNPRFGLVHHLPVSLHQPRHNRIQMVGLASRPPRIN
ncbi:MAG: helix-turn-helix transcriptional regulator [Proteobacteria bacterium]|nr:helix-turn-helix transcriptional regulator [Pseudomonadota bacterium]